LNIESKGANAPDIACTLTEGEQKTRRQFVREKLKPHMQLLKQSSRELRITFSTTINRSDVEEFVELESQCCGFLDFEIGTTERAVTLEIAGPVGAERVLEMFAKQAAR